MADEVVEAEVIAEEKPEVVQEEAPVEEAEKEEVKAEEAEPEVKPEEKPAEESEEKQELPKWVKIELSKRSDKIAAARQELAEKNAEIERLRLANGDPSKLPDDYVPKAQVNALVQQAKEEERYIENCNIANEAGQKTYKDWNDTITMLQSLGGFDIPTMRGIMATGAAEKALYQLGKNPDEYHRVMDLPIERRIVEITKLTERVTPKQVSQAPAPIRTVGGTAAPSKVELNDKMSDDEWYAAAKALRAKKVAARR